MRFILFFFCCTLTILNGQDAQFSQMETAPTSLNPALTGAITGSTRLIAKSRIQWNSILADRGIQNYYFSTEYRKCVGDNFFGIGLSLQRDQLGNSLFYNQNISLSASYHQNLSGDLYLAAGFNAGILEYGFDENNLQFDEQFDGDGFNGTFNNFENFTANQLMKPNIDIGLSFYNTDKKWIIGGALFHTNQPAYSFLDNQANNRLGVGLSLHGAITIDFGTNDKQSLLWRGIFRKQALINNSKQWQFQGGTVYKFNLIKTNRGLWDFSVGLSGRLTGNDADAPITLDAIIPSFSFTNDRLGIHFSYDTNVSTLANSTMLRGAMELTLTLDFGTVGRCLGVCPSF